MTYAHQALRDAVVALSAERSVSDLTVSEVCRKAGISRDSFYRLASCPAELLAEYLYEDHDVNEAIAGHATGEHDGADLITAMGLLVAHVQRNLSIYRNAVDPHFPPLLQDALLRRMSEVLRAHVRDFPDRTPRLDHDRRGVTEDAFVAYLAFATLGAVESLVRTGGIEDAELSVSVLRSAIAPVWIVGERGIQTSEATGGE